MQVAVFPAASVAVHTTTVLPTSKFVPDVESHDTVTAVASDTVGAVHDTGLVLVAKSSGQEVNVGGSGSTKVKIC